MAEKMTAQDVELQESTDKWRLAGLVLMGLFFLAFPLFRFYEPAQRADAREAQMGFLAEEGSELYETNCAECHGVAGTGAIAPAIGSKEFLESVEDEQISQLTALGVPGSEMVAYSNDFGGPLTSQEINAITVYLRSLEEEAESNPLWRTPLARDDLTGDQLFALACARCHGIDAEGIEDLAPDISQDSFTLMESDEFIIGRITDGYKLMPRFGTVLTDEQIATIVTWMRFGTDVPPETTTTTTVPGGQGNGQGNGQGTTTTTTSQAEGPSEEVLALGEFVYQEGFGFDGCSECHGADANGSNQGPSILGASRSSIVRALNGVPDMEVDEPLTQEEIDAVWAYITLLTQQRSG
jgi:mono/diheme cytochrome c family protein